MAHGGPRQGAGRKPGSVNKATAEAREKAEAGGVMPLDYMLSIMRDEDAEPAARMDMAKAAAPYVHAKLAALSVDLNANHTIADVSDEPLSEDEWVSQLGA